MIVNVLSFFTLIPACPSSSSASDASSVKLFVVSAFTMIRVSVLLLQEIGAVVVEVRSRPSNTIVTSVVFFFTAMEPFLQEPEKT